MKQFLLELLGDEPDAGAEVIDLCLDHALLREEHPEKFSRIEGMQLFPALEVLSISMQALESMAGLGHLPHLHSLNLSLNQITGIEALGRLPALRQLDLSHNLLESLQGLRELPRLRELNLGHNYLSEMDFPAALPALETLVLSGNRRIKVIRGLSAMPRLRHLYLKGCFIADWDGLRDATLLSTLSISPGSFEPLGVLCDLEALDELWVGASRLTGQVVLPPMPSLRSLNLTGGGGLQELSGWEGLPGLESLVLRQNRLQKLDGITVCPRLRHLDLSYNPLASLPDLGGFSTLETVILEGSPVHPKAILDLQEALPGVEFRY